MKEIIFTINGQRRLDVEVRIQKLAAVHGEEKVLKRVTRFWKCETLDQCVREVLAPSDKSVVERAKRFAEILRLFGSETVVREIHRVSQGRPEANTLRIAAST